MKKNVYLIDLGTGTDRSLIPLGCGLIISYSQTITELEESFNFDILMLEETLEEEDLYEVELTEEEAAIDAMIAEDNEEVPSNPEDYKSQSGYVGVDENVKKKA